MLKVIEMLPVEMTEEEKMKLGQDIAELEIEIEQIEADKKRDNDHYNSKLKERAATCLMLSKELKQGTKNVEVECYWQQDDPRPGMKALYRYDNGEMVRTEEMSLFDDQTDLQMEDSYEVVDDDHLLTYGDVVPENPDKPEGVAA